MIANGPSHLAWGPVLYDKLGLRVLLSFFSNRVVRGGPRVLLHLALCLLAIIVLTRYLPQRFSDATFGSSYANIWHWTGDVQRGGQPAALPPANATVSGGLRIVVFGETDIATPSRGSSSHVEPARTSWTEELCKQLECSSYLSFVPPGRSLVSNNLYEETVGSILNATVKEAAPGRDFSYLSQAYPVQWDAPDIEAQVSAFLSMPRPARPPKETLWVISFGTWDIWAAAALPNFEAVPLVDSLIADVYRNIERLYNASMDATSIAYSDYFETDKVSLAAANRSTAEATMDESAAPVEWADAEMEPFRILVSNLFDPSLTPGWQLLRPALPKAHSKAEQMRNAASLTSRWNLGMRNAMDTWVKTPQPDEKGETAANKPPAPPPNLSSKKRRRVAAAAAAVSPSPPPPPPSPLAYPLRDGITYNLPDYLLDVIIDRQMRSLELQDANGFGQLPTDQGFLEVSAPCAMPPPPPPSQDKKTNGTSGADEEAKMKKRTKTKTKSKGESDDETKKVAEDIADDADLNICDTPHEHLFYAPFTLGQRAIDEIARQSANMVRSNNTVRAFWAGKGQLAPPRLRKPGTWNGDF